MSSWGRDTTSSTRADLLACNASVNTVRSAPNAARFTPFPAQTLDGSSTLFMAMHFDDSSPLVILAINGVPGSSSVTESAATLAIRGWTSPPNAEQQGSQILLDTGDAGVLSVAAQNSSLWVTGNEACQPSGDTKPRSCLRLIEVRTSSTPTVNQDMTFGVSASTTTIPPLLRTVGAISTWCSTRPRRATLPACGTPGGSAATC
jgi:hypothetical protein